MRDGELILSISMPVISLASKIEPRALMAWDPRLLSKTQYFTMIISGMQQHYPFIQSNGAIVESLATRGMKNLQFHVGLTSDNKPSEDLLQKLLRNFASFKDTDEQVASKEDDVNDDFGYDFVTEETDQKPNNEFSFALSTSLESLLCDRFLEILRLRLRYNLGWAAAETLVSCANQTQIPPDELFLDDSTVRFKHLILLVLYQIL